MTQRISEKPPKLDKNAFYWNLLIISFFAYFISFQQSITIYNFCHIFFPIDLIFQQSGVSIINTIQNFIPTIIYFPWFLTTI